MAGVRFLDIFDIFAQTRAFQVHILPYFCGMKFLIFCLFFISFLLACDDRRDQIIAEKVAERVEKERSRKSADCRNQLLSSAGKIADSLLLEAAKMELQDSLFQNRPVRPTKPATVPPLDSAAVKPIFKENSSQ